MLPLTPSRPATASFATGGPTPRTHGLAGQAQGSSSRSRAGRRTFFLMAAARPGSLHPTGTRPIPDLVTRPSAPAALPATSVAVAQPSAPPESPPPHPPPRQQPPSGPVMVLTIKERVPPTLGGCCGPWSPLPPPPLLLRGTTAPPPPPPPAPGPLLRTLSPEPEPRNV